MSNHKLFPEKIKSRIAADLPGWDAQQRMAPLSRKPYSSYKPLLPDARRSGVLLLMYPAQGEWYTVLIRRGQYDGVHSGQISIPGGKEEQTDQSIAHTALREANEEVNVHPDKVTIVGQLTQLYIPPSNFLVFPLVGFSEEKPQFKPEAKEVQKIIEVPLSLLLDPSMVKKKPMMMRSGLTVDTPFYDLYGHIVWGATAMILSEFVEVLRSSGYHKIKYKV